MLVDLAVSGCAPTPAAVPPVAPSLAPTVSLVSPEVSADGRVTFRFRAPQAKAVSLSLEGSASIPMADEEGVWTVTTSPLTPDFYGYSFVQDGQTALDPVNPLIKSNLIGPQNLVHVPGSGAWEIADVPRGAIHRHFFRSEVVGDDRDFYVYTPPGYESAGDKTYPTLYLLHGFSDDASGWTAVGRAHVILDNLIAEGKAAPMIVVMPLGYGEPALLAGGFSGYGRDRGLLERNFDKFQDSLMREVLPRVEASYRVGKDRDARAIAGLSMGGAESLLTGLNRTEQFGWIGSMSSGGLTAAFEAEFPRLHRARRPRLVWIACGVDDRLIAINRELRRWLEAEGLAPIGVETAGAHTWMVWRRNLVDFVSLIFRDAPPTK